jgi:hypothetical protein
MGVVRQWMSGVVFICGGVKWVYGHMSGDWHVEGKAFKQGTMNDNSVSTIFTRTTNEGRGGIHRRALPVFKIRLKCTKDLQARGCCLSRRPTFFHRRHCSVCAHYTELLISSTSSITGPTLKRRYGKMLFKHLQATLAAVATACGVVQLPLRRADVRALGKRQSSEAPLYLDHQKEGYLIDVEFLKALCCIYQCLTNRRSHHWQRQSDHSAPIRHGLLHNLGQSGLCQYRRE